MTTAALAEPTDHPADRYADPRHWRSVAERAQAQGDVDLALHAWLHLQELRPESPEVQFHIACCLALRQEIGRACLAFYALADRANAPAALRQRAAKLAALLDPEPQPVVVPG